jgi:hypothetical protein
MIWVGYLGILSWIPLGALSAWIILTGQLKTESSLRERVPPDEGSSKAGYATLKP